MNSANKMSVKLKFYIEIKKLGDEELATIFDKTGYPEVAEVVREKNLEGNTFLDLTEYEIKSWRLGRDVTTKLWSCLESVRSSPEKFVSVKDVRGNIFSSRQNNLIKNRLENVFNSSAPRNPTSSRKQNIQIQNNDSEYLRMERQPVPEAEAEETMTVMYDQSGYLLPVNKREEINEYEPSPVFNAYNNNNNNNNKLSRSANNTTTTTTFPSPQKTKPAEVTNRPPAVLPKDPVKSVSPGRSNNAPSPAKNISSTKNGDDDDEEQVQVYEEVQDNENNKNNNSNNLRTFLHRTFSVNKRSSTSPKNETPPPLPNRSSSQRSSSSSVFKYIKVDPVPDSKLNHSIKQKKSKMTAISKDELKTHIYINVTNESEDEAIYEREPEVVQLNPKKSNSSSSLKSLAERPLPPVPSHSTEDLKTQLQKSPIFSRLDNNNQKKGKNELPPPKVGDELPEYGNSEVILTSVKKKLPEYGRNAEHTTVDEHLPEYGNTGTFVSEKKLESSIINELAEKVKFYTEKDIQVFKSAFNMHLQQNSNRTLEKTTKNKKEPDEKPELPEYGNAEVVIKESQKPEQPKTSKNANTKKPTLLKNGTEAENAEPPVVVNEDSSDDEYAESIFIFNSEPFYRNTDRKGAKLLLNDLEDGAFLFRPSSKFFLTLTVKKKGKYFNLGIQKKADNTIFCNPDSESISPSFPSLTAMIKHFERKPLTLRNGTQITELYLKKVLPTNRV